jgi:phosphate uptake regulator
VGYTGGHKMKRKLVEQGGTTMMVSLPSKWVKRFDLGKGDEVDVAVDGKQVHISSETVNRTRVVEVDLRGASTRVIKWVVSGLHKFGYDEIEILYDTNETLDTVDWLIKNLMIGFTVIEQTQKRIILRNVTQDTDVEFDATLRRAFRVTCSLADSSLEMITDTRMQDAVQLVKLEHTNNQLTNYCERILNKRGYVESKKTAFMYTIIWNLEKVADDYKYICEYISSDGAPIDSSVRDIYSRVNEYFRGYYDLFYSFSYQRLLKLNQEKDELFASIGERLADDTSDKQILSYLESLVYKITDFSTSMVCVNLKEV